MIRDPEYRFLRSRDPWKSDSRETLTIYMHRYIDIHKEDIDEDDDEDAT